MSISLSISPHGRLLVQESREDTTDDRAAAAPTEARILRAFQRGESAGLLHLATVELQSALPSSFSFAREIGRDYLTRLCHMPGLDGADGPADLQKQTRACGKHRRGEIEKWQDHQVG